MTTFKTGDMWTRFGKVDLFCITINSTFKADGRLVMGAGITNEAKKAIIGLEQEAGYQLTGNTYFPR